MHLAVNPNGHIGVSVVPLRFEFEVWCKVVAPIDLCDAVENISMEDLEGFAVNCNLLSMKLGAGGW